ncbi:hypothetical protein KP509_31G033900 [Ceratopteris richardii]|uniref:Uncharacterized protein n=1 Tax=Ceratopteris richardii TaxID=49495 RepID=A0A8T2QYE1_CERRI|nr:hypothetical protein KP509_31G033900 [Ceratopteris richardii]
MLRLKIVSSLCLRRGTLSGPIQRRFSSQSTRLFLWSSNKPSPLKILPAFLCLRHHFSVKQISSFGGIAAAGAFASSFVGRRGILQAHEGTEDEDHPILWDGDESPLFIWLRRLYVPFLMVMTIAMGWHYPLSLTVNLLILFWSTKPRPSSIYLWVEQRKLQAASQGNGLSRLKNQLSSATLMTHVEVEDYGLACVARVSSLSQKMLVIGVLGDWWVLYSCSSSISGFNIGSWFPISPLDQW